VRNRKTGEIKTQISKMTPIEYEFECEALADYAYQIDQNCSNKEKIETDLIRKVGEMEYQGGLEMCKP